MRSHTHVLAHVCSFRGNNIATIEQSNIAELQQERAARFISFVSKMQKTKKCHEFQDVLNEQKTIKEYVSNFLCFTEAGT